MVKNFRIFDDVFLIQQLEKFFSREKIDILINCAAYTNVDGAESVSYTHLRAHETLR